MDAIGSMSPRHGFSDHAAIRPSPTQDTEMQWQQSPNALVVSKHFRHFDSANDGTWLRAPFMGRCINIPNPSFN